MESLIDNSKTDKNTTHSYLSTYNEIFSPLKDSARNVLEIGIQNGGSLKLWNDYFPNATIHGFDISPAPDWLSAFDRVKTLKQDAYNIDFVKKLKESGITFDIMIDDGPHTKDSVLFFIQQYTPLLSEKGIMVVEDVQAMEWIEELSKQLPDVFETKSADLRKTKGRYDDILFIAKRKAILPYLKSYLSSAWIGHFEFAQWLVTKLDPKVIVDLGVDRGHSSFCLASKCNGNVYGIDNFVGDEFYGKHKDNAYEFVKEVYKKLVDHHLLKDNLEIIKGNFDDIVPTFDKTIDILHIDGFHNYDAVKNDFAKWFPKVHEHGVVLLHDVVAYKTTVGKFYDEIDLPKTMMPNSAGLGIVSRDQKLIDMINGEWITKLVYHPRSITHPDFPDLSIAKFMM